MLVEEFVEKSVVGRFMGCSWSYSTVTGWLGAGGGGGVAVGGAQVGHCPGVMWLVLIGQQVAPNSQNKSGKRCVVVRFHLGLA